MLFNNPKLRGSSQKNFDLSEQEKIFGLRKSNINHKKIVVVRNKEQQNCPSELPLVFNDRCNHSGEPERNRFS